MMKTRIILTIVSFILIAAVLGEGEQIQEDARIEEIETVLAQEEGEVEQPTPVSDDNKQTQTEADPSESLLKEDLQVQDVADVDTPAVEDTEETKVQTQVILLDAEIDALTEMIQLYEDKIKLLEGAQDPATAQPEKTRINEKGERVKVGKGTSKSTLADPELIDYYHYFQDKRSQEVDEHEHMETEVRLITEKIELMFGQDIRALRFINVKAIARSSQG